MEILKQTTEDVKKLSEAYSNASGLKNEVELHEDKKYIFEMHNAFIFQKDDSLLSVVETEKGNMLASNSIMIKDSLEFILQATKMQMPQKVEVSIQRSIKSNRDYLAMRLI